MMNWYIFYTPRGWAAIRSEKRTLFATVLPTPSPLNTFHHHIKQTGYNTRFIAWDDYSVPLINKFRSYFNGEIINDWDIELDLSHRSEFARETMLLVHSIPYGQVMTYGQVARQLGRPGAARAVGQVMRTNPMGLIVPCHRVISSSGWGGFSAAGGLDLKTAMLHMEWQQTGQVPPAAQHLAPG
jgi:methylated-DNA-[protein]-cysteine S-methyltransferase